MIVRRLSQCVGAAALLAMVLLAGPTATVPVAGAPQDAEAALRFEARDIYIDTKDRPLAAYQFEFRDPSGRSAVVGVEGGQHPAFADAPYYDSAALSRGRLIVADFNTGKDLPSGRTRIARLHLRIRGERAPEFEVELAVSASSEGEEVPATVSVERTQVKGR